MRTLRHRRVLITGGAQGIGLQAALAFAREGAEILLADLKTDSLASAAEQVRAAGAPRVFTYTLDVTDFPAILRLRERIHAEAGKIHVLVNNAGTVFGGLFLDVPLEKHLKTYEVNTLGLVAMTHAFLPDLIAQDEGHLVNIASAAGWIPLPWGTTYGSSKWSVVGFSESIRHELMDTGRGHVGVTAICPSVVNTGLFAGTKPAKTTKELTPEYIASRILRATRRNEPMVLAPAMVRVGILFRGIFPLWLNDKLGRWFGVNHVMRTWRGHTAPATTAGNEAEPMPAPHRQPVTSGTRESVG